MRSFVIGMTGLLSSRGIQAWMSTLDYRACYHDPTVDPVRQTKQPGIYVFWHENILFPLYLRGRCNLSMLLSKHRDAEVLSVIARLSGFGVVRGSTGRGGRDALKQLMRLSRTQHLTITPDGPRGPRRRMSEGAIYLASRTGMPLVPMGFGYAQPWRLRSWDRFAVPKPFSRARAIIGPPTLIPRGIDREQTNVYRQQVEELITTFTDEAEAWAISGTRRRGEVVLRSEPAWPIRPQPIANQHIPARPRAA